VVTLTLNRPQAFNACPRPCSRRCRPRSTACAADLGARGRDRGRRPAFCAGHDLKEMRAEPSLAYYQRLFAQCGRMMMTIQRCRCR
jgi:enoyl-CoA hydratase/carnithine racemase